MSITSNSIVSKLTISAFVLLSVLSIPRDVMADVPAEVQAVFVNNGCLNCHSGNNPSAGLSLDDAATSEIELVNVNSSLAGCNLQRVTPGEPANSTLYDKISQNNPQCGGVMPPGGPQISVADQNTIFDWIISIGPAAQFGLIEMQSVTASAQETDPEVTLTVMRQLGTQGQISVDYTVATVGTDTATSPDDYVADTGTLVFADGETSKTITVTLADDDVYEGAEVFSVTLSNVVNGAVLGGQAQTKVTILDNEISNEPGTFFFSRVNYSVAENASTYDVTILRSFGGAGQVTVNLDTIGGTATDATDYQTFNQTLTFAEGEQSQTVTLTILDDQEVEGDESYSLRLSNPTNGAVLGNPSTVNVTISDDESTDPGDGGGDDGSGDGGDDGSGDDSGTQFEVPEQEDFSAAGSLGLLTIFLCFVGGLVFRPRNRSEKY
ncbi:MAG: hypothetical protein OQK51_06330 [Kangiellaceae bacterium]|nr:hypothetical protein [Kangiellaceae bacterium]